MVRDRLRRGLVLLALPLRLSVYDARMERLLSILQIPACLLEVLYSIVLLLTSKPKDRLTVDRLLGRKQLREESLRSRRVINLLSTETGRFRILRLRQLLFKLRLVGESRLQVHPQIREQQMLLPLVCRVLLAPGSPRLSPRVGRFTKSRLEQSFNHLKP